MGRLCGKTEVRLFHAISSHPIPGLSIAVPPKINESSGLGRTGLGLKVGNYAGG